MKSPRKPWCPYCLNIRLVCRIMKTPAFRHIWWCEGCGRTFCKASSLGNWPDYLCETNHRTMPQKTVTRGTGMRITDRLILDGFKCGFSFQEIAQRLRIKKDHVEGAVRRAL